MTQMIDVAFRLSKSDAEYMLDGLNDDEGLRNLVTDFLLLSSGQDAVRRRLVYVRGLAAFSAGLRAGLERVGAWDPQGRLSALIRDIGANVGDAIW